MKNLISIEELKNDELLSINGGSELSDSLLGGIGWLIGGTVNCLDLCGQGAAYFWSHGGR